MSETHKKGFDADLVTADLENCCRGVEVCGQCHGTHCPIG